MPFALGSAQPAEVQSELIEEVITQEMKHTVAIPTYCRPTELRRALLALTAQLRPVDELLVTVRRDDDQSPVVLREFETRLPIRMEWLEGAGVVRAINRCLDVARGDILTFLDDDAVPPPEWSQKIVHAFAAQPDLAALGGRDHVYENGAWIDGKAEIVGVVRWYGRVIGNHHIGVGPQRNVDCLKGVNFSLRQRTIGSLRVDRRLRGTGAQWHWELDLCLALRARGERVAYDPSITVDHITARRFDEDQRNQFHAQAYENQIYNLTLVLMKYLKPAGRIFLLSYALLIGLNNGYCGLLKGVLLWPLRGKVALQKMRASATGVLAGWREWKKSHECSMPE
jgi:glycosyltransferase involved in cell wall biosynthesis